ncbi:unnamed protein product [Symbiodinium pilosum]|uniref:Uncharacterized protein n=1 Tax=Symbiodinium pilosum TaxID=2952 RepID=A0A812WGS9_SYMPI|nr:unnamed protein product [Symbiodinium pilosum]
MWKMIEEDVCTRYNPGQGRLRLIVITDGYDTHSPGDYCGIRGMDPLMKELQKQGFDVEWHIVILGRGFQAEERRSYEDGGASSEASHRFLEALREGSGSRQARQQAYLADTAAGRMQKVEWFKALPPAAKRFEKWLLPNANGASCPGVELLNKFKQHPGWFVLVARPKRSIMDIAPLLAAKMRFADLPLAAEGKQAMQEALAHGGFGLVADTFETEIQQKSFEAIRAGAEVVARAKTGEVEMVAAEAEKLTKYYTTCRDVLVREVLDVVADLRSRLLEYCLDPENQLASRFAASIGALDEVVDIQDPCVYIAPATVTEYWYSFGPPSTAVPGSHTFPYHDPMRGARWKGFQDDALDYAIQSHEDYSAKMPLMQLRHEAFMREFRHLFRYPGGASPGSASWSKERPPPVRRIAEPEPERAEQIAVQM